MFERILKWYQQCYGLDYVMFRYFNVGGSTSKNGERRKEETRLLPTIMKCIQNNEILKIFGILSANHKHDILQIINTILA